MDQPWPTPGSAQFGAPYMQPMCNMADPDDLDSSGDNLSYNQRNVKKWEVDEPLGDMATISPVLYANLCHPELKDQFPGKWNMISPVLYHNLCHPEHKDQFPAK